MHRRLLTLDEISKMMEPYWDKLESERKKEACEHDRLNDYGDACLDCHSVYLEGQWQ